MQKSMLLRAVVGLNYCYSGEIILNGHDIASMRVEEMAKHQPSSQSDARALPICGVRTS